MAFHVLDQLSVGIVLVDRCARVVFANAAAQSLSIADGPMGPRLGATSALPARRLRELVQSVLKGATVRATTLPSASGGQPLTVLVSPVPGTELLRADMPRLNSAAALVMFCDPDRRGHIPSALMMEAYRLTLAEARVAIMIYGGDTVADAARRLRVSRNTVKTHLRRVYQKTGISRQAQLFQLMTTISLARVIASDT